jgi:LytR cell envelope-related transcriptional attenuator
MVAHHDRDATMTIAPTQGSGAHGSAAADVDPSPRPVVRSATRVRKARQRRRRATIVQSVLTVVFVVALVALGLVGWRSSLKLTGGRDLEVTDPAAPGYVAEVNPTTADLVAVTASDGSLATMLLLLGGEEDMPTTVVPISAWLTLWEFEDAPPASAHELFASGGLDALRLRLGVDLTFGATDAVTVAGSTFEELAQRIGPITVDLPDNVIVDAGNGGEVRYPAGAVTLQPTDLLEFLSIRGDGEAEYSRALRLSQVWTELFAGSAAQGGTLEAPAGSSDDALAAEILGGLDGATAQLELLPTKEIPLNVSPPVSLNQVDRDAMATWVPTYVPFPVSAYPGQRPTVDLLNGTTDPAAIEAVAPRVVTAGAEIALTGNAESFDVATSRVEYSSDATANAAEAIAAQLGLTATRTDDTTRAVDVTVVVGKDLVT